MSNSQYYKKNTKQNDIIDDLLLTLINVLFSIFEMSIKFAVFIVSNVLSYVWQFIKHLFRAIFKTKAKETKSIKSLVGNAIVDGKVTNRKIYLSDIERTKHQLITGATGGGKSNYSNLNIINLIQRGDLLVLFDPKAASAQEVYEKLPSVENVKLYDLGKDTDKYIFGYNPLVILDVTKQNQDRLLAEIKDRMIPNILGLTDSQVEANKLLINCLHFHKAYFEWLYKKGKTAEECKEIIRERQLTLPDIAKIRSSFKYRINFKNLMCEVFCDYDNAIYDYFCNTLLDDKNMLHPRLNSVTSNLSSLCVNNPYEDFLQAKGFNPVEDMLNGKSVIINYDGCHEFIVDGTISLFFTKIYDTFRQINRENQNNPKKKKTIYMIVEEAHALNFSPKELENIIRMGRSQGIHLILINQDLDPGFKKEIRDVITQNIGTHIDFKYKNGKCDYKSPDYPIIKEGREEIKKIIQTPLNHYEVVRSYKPVKGESINKINNIIKMKEQDIKDYFLNV